MFIPYRKNKGYKLPLIFEFGSQNIRAGYAGQDSPEVMVASEYLMDNEDQMKFLEFNSTHQVPNYEVRQLQQDIDMWKEHIDNIVTNVLGYEKNVPFFLIEDTIVKKETRTKMIELLFEELEVSSVFFHRNTLLTQYLLARETLLVIDLGAYQTTVTPIIEGNVIEKGIIRGEVGQEFISQKLAEVWLPQGKRYSRYLNYNELTPSVQSFGDMEVIREIRHSMCKFYEFPIQQLKFNPAVDNLLYELPDGSKLELSSECYTAMEGLFDPSEQFQGLDKAIEQSLEKIDQDFRKELIQNIVVIGGGALASGVLERIQRSLNSMKFNYNRARIQQLPKNIDIQNAAWVGASIVASSPIFDQWTLTKSDYDEHGTALIDKKMFY